MQVYSAYDTLIYLKHLESGLDIRKNWLKYFNNFYIFSNNAKINQTNYDMASLDEHYQTLDALFDSEESIYSLNEYIKKELTFLPEWGK